MMRWAEFQSFHDPTSDNDEGKKEAKRRRRRQRVKAVTVRMDGWETAFPWRHAVVIGIQARIQARWAFLSLFVETGSPAVVSSSTTAAERRPHTERTRARLITQLALYGVASTIVEDPCSSLSLVDAPSAGERLLRQSSRRSGIPIPIVWAAYEITHTQYGARNSRHLVCDSQCSPFLCVSNSSPSPSSSSSPSPKFCSSSSKSLLEIPEPPRPRLLSLPSRRSHSPVAIAGWLWPRRSGGGAAPPPSDKVVETSQKGAARRSGGR
ncbi:hypothetical protein J3F83DRAFT_745803 [Trichoderma novae-zelandiae]